MNAHIIAVAGHAYSTEAARRCQDQFEALTGVVPAILWACTPQSLPVWEDLFPVEWKEGFSTESNEVRRATAMSHLVSWDIASMEPTIIMEHDAYFHTDPTGITEEFMESEYNAFTYNSRFDVRDRVGHGEGIQPASRLAGMAYILKPQFAGQLVDYAVNCNYWTNDKFICSRENPWIEGLSYHSDGFADKHIPGMRYISTSGDTRNGSNHT